MTDSREPTGKRVVVGMVLGLVAVTATLGAVLGYVIPARTGLEEVTVLAITFTVSPITFAAYGGVTVATFLLTLLLVLEVVSRFDEHAV